MPIHGIVHAEFLFGGTVDTTSSQKHLEFAHAFVKSDGVKARLVGAIRARLQDAGLRIVAERRFQISPEQAIRHYDKNDAWCEKFGKKRNAQLREQGEASCVSDLGQGKRILQSVRDSLCESSVYDFILIGERANDVLRELVGPTDPAEARIKFPHSIRALSPDAFALADTEMRPVRNIIHASESEEEALREIRNLWPAIFVMLRRMLGVSRSELQEMSTLFGNLADVPSVYKPMHEMVRKLEQIL